MSDDHTSDCGVHEGYACTCKSKAVSARYANPCPVCKAKSLEPCRTLTTGRVTDTHLPRLDALYNPPESRESQGLPCTCTPGPHGGAPCPHSLLLPLRDGGCPTPGCRGDHRYAAPGRGHATGCTYPYNLAESRGSEDTHGLHS